MKEAIVACGTSGMDLNSTPIPSMATTPIPLSSKYFA